MDSPYWKIDENSMRETVNYEAYKSYFNSDIITKPPGYVVEVSRETGSVRMLPSLLVHILTNMTKWVKVFAPIVAISSAERITDNATNGSQNGALQLIQAEFQVICPFIQKRKVKFLRYSKKIRKGVWAVVDVTLPPENEEAERFMYEQGLPKRLPSGVIIEDMGNNSSQVTWIEHTEYDESRIYQPYRALIDSGIGFGARRWLMTLQRYCDTYSIHSYISLSGPNQADSKL
ncbi:unnamed protein product [Microthlaspi erraticum]|uniref:START domain-containing protein n=1 Tax=Microthlaspi erraticum TaxID=1685480 RepID=A0A6D2L601_9BRAS|nr:unnamed protein product [Microthlaspi erraticum]